MSLQYTEYGRGWLVTLSISSLVSSFLFFSSLLYFIFFSSLLFSIPSSSILSILFIISIIYSTSSLALNIISSIQTPISPAGLPKTTEQPISSPLSDQRPPESLSLTARNSQRACQRLSVSDQVVVSLPRSV